MAYDSEVTNNDLHEAFDSKDKTYYLDKFAQDCISNKEAHDMSVKKHSHTLTAYITIIGIVALFAYQLLLSVSDNTELNNIVGNIVGIIIVVMVITLIIKAIKLSTETNELSDDPIDYNNLDNFLKDNNITSFDYFGKSFCVNDSSISNYRPAKNPILLLIFILVEFVFLASVYCIGYVCFDGNPLANANFAPAYFAILPGTAAIGIIVFVELKKIFELKRCTERVDFTCVDVQCVRSPNGDKRRETRFRHFYYLKHNGKGYILFKQYWSEHRQAEVGDVKTNYYINPNNPYDYFEKEPISSIFSSLVIVAVLFGITVLLMYIVCTNPTL